VFPSEVDLITVDAAVVDSAGNAIEGLTKNDFVLEEDGQPQEIVIFEAVSVADTARTAAPVPEPSAIATSSERLPGRAFAIVADDLRLPGEETLPLRRVIASFIEKSLCPGDIVIVSSTSGEAWWLAQMPESREDLLAVLNRLKGHFVDPSTREHMTEYEAFWIIHRESRLSPSGKRKSRSTRGPH
jgi:VWFA-related protein